MGNRHPTILIAGYYGFGNAGDEAILAAMLRDLAQPQPGAHFVVASGAPDRTTAEHQVASVSRDDLRAMVDAVRSSDLVLLGGGGLFQDYWHVPSERLLTPNSGGLPAYVSVPVLAALCARPCMLYGVGIGPLGTEEGRLLTRAAFELCGAATVRDEGSLGTLQAIGLSPAALSRVRVTADPAFTTPGPSPQASIALTEELGLRNGEPLIGVALRPWEFAPQGEAWLPEVANALSARLRATGARALFLPFSAEDSRVGAEVAAALADPTRAVVVDRPLPAAALFSLLGRCATVLAMRYHAALFGLAAGSAVTALDYDPKVGHLMRAAGSADLALPISTWSSAAVVDALSRARPAMAGFVDQMRQRATANAATAMALLATGPPPVPEGSALIHAVAIEKALKAAALESAPAALGEQVRRLEEATATANRRVAAESLEVERLSKLRDMLIADCESAREEAEATANESQRLREQRDFLAADGNELRRRLEAYEQTLAYSLSRRLWATLRRAFPEGSSRRKIYRAGRRLGERLLGRGPAAASSQASAASQLPDPYADLLAFEDRIRGGKARRVVAIFSATQLEESEGQRPTQLALALAAAEVPVIFFYWRWWADERRTQDRLEQGIVQVPIDLLAARPEMLTETFSGYDRLALFEFPWPGFFEVVAAANATGWVTLYDVLDDWEEFHRVGQAVWYDEAFERHLINACDAVFGINAVLADRLQELGAREVAVVGNGFKPGLERVRAPRPMPRGDLTIGYFGYLAGAWFDWGLVAAAAAARPAWLFYLIGYGGSPEGIELPPNVHLLGKQPQGDLAGFAANWDVAIIPFKPDRLAAGADPIKTYEYLAMGLPVVVTGVSPPAGAEEFVLRAEGLEGFLRALEAAAGQRTARTAERLAYAASCGWAQRLAAILAAVDSGAQGVAAKRALFATS